MCRDTISLSQNGIRHCDSSQPPAEPDEQGASGLPHTTLFGHDSDLVWSWVPATAPTMTLVGVVKGVLTTLDPRAALDGHTTGGRDFLYLSNAILDQSCPGRI